MPIENISFTQAGTVPGPFASGEPEATPAPRQPKSDAKVGSSASSLPQLLQAKAPARPVPAAQEPLVTLNLASQLQSDQAAMNMLAQAQAEMLSTGLEGLRKLMESTKEATKSAVESLRKD
jgi:hypothetical protein